MRRELADLGENITFTGALPYNQVQAELPHHDVFFLCSDYEGLPLSLLEAMSAGLVPVVSDLPSGISEAVSESNGIRIPPDREDLFVAALVRLVNDPRLLEQLSQLARKDAVQHFSIQSMTSKWDTLLGTLPERHTTVWKLKDHVTVPPNLKHRWLYPRSMRPVRKFFKLWSRKLRNTSKA
jgi:glycosyltransferase involved in cell wall biosynthesis